MIKANIAWNTLLKAFRGEGVEPKIAARIAVALERELESLLAPWDPRYRRTVLGVDWEWEVDDHLQPGRCASNGLHFFVCRMRHRHMQGRFGRGKCYHLSGLSTREHEEKRKYLLRHAEVTHAVGDHLHLAETVAVTPVAGEAAWWIVDKWIPGQTLEQLLNDKSDDGPPLPRLAHDILAGLEALHQRRIVMRELAPSRMIIAADDGRAVLTDFELAKLLDGAPSGLTDWPEDAYRAPEVETGRVDPRADLYSWARIVVHFALGALPEAGRESSGLSALRLPQRIDSLLRQALSPNPDDRPPDVRRVLRSIRAWK